MDFYSFAVVGFSLTIQTSIGKRSFIFTRLHYADRKVYHVVVFGEYMYRYFTMVQIDEEWQFSKPHLIDHWMKEVKEQLIEAIFSNCKD